MRQSDLSPLTSRLPSPTTQRGYRDAWTTLTFAVSPIANVSITVETLVPEGCTPATPCPLVTTQLQHRRCAGAARGFRPPSADERARTLRSWAIVGVQRGYAALLTPNADPRTSACAATPSPARLARPQASGRLARSDDETDGFRLAYPDATWGLIRRRAWLGSRALDWALSLPGIDASQVAITGHSRNAKLALIQAAWDERITVVAASSSGSPAMSPYR